MSSEEENQKLKKKIQELEEALEEKEKDYKKLKKEFEEFKAEHTVTVSNLQKALKVKPNLSGAKQPGLKKGHKPHYRLSPEPDVEKQLKLDRCPLQDSADKPRSGMEKQNNNRRSAQNESQKHEIPYSQKVLPVLQKTGRA